MSALLITLRLLEAKTWSPSSPSAQSCRGDRTTKLTTFSATLSQHWATYALTWLQRINPEDPTPRTSLSGTSSGGLVRDWGWGPLFSGLAEFRIKGHPNLSYHNSQDFGCHPHWKPFPSHSHSVLLLLQSWTLGLGHHGSLGCIFFLNCQMVVSATTLCLSPRPRGLSLIPKVFLRAFREPCLSSSVLSPWTSVGLPGEQRIL